MFKQIKKYKQYKKIKSRLDIRLKLSMKYGFNQFTWDTILRMARVERIGKRLLIIYWTEKRYSFIDYAIMLAFYEILTGIFGG